MYELRILRRLPRPLAQAMLRGWSNAPNAGSIGVGPRPRQRAQIARLLNPFGISPGTIRFPDDCTAKGYYLNAFADAFVRYLPPENVTPSQPKGFCGAPPGFKTVTGERV
jgi:hypothetical protein